MIFLATCFGIDFDEFWPFLNIVLEVGVAFGRMFDAFGSSLDVNFGRVGLVFGVILVLCWSNWLHSNGFNNIRFGNVIDTVGSTSFHK